MEVLQKEVNEFVAGNAALVKEVEVSLTEAGKKFIASQGNIIPVGTKNIAAQKLQDGDIVGFMLTLRVLAAEFVTAGVSSVFWDLVDAIGFYDDATNAHWKHMTRDQRENRLKWAGQYAKLV